MPAGRFRPKRTKAVRSGRTCGAELMRADSGVEAWRNRRARKNLRRWTDEAKPAEGTYKARRQLANATQEGDRRAANFCSMK